MTRTVQEKIVRQMGLHGDGETSPAADLNPFMWVSVFTQLINYLLLDKKVGVIFASWNMKKQKKCTGKVGELLHIKWFYLGSGIKISDKWLDGWREEGHSLKWHFSHKDKKKKKAAYRFKQGAVACVWVPHGNGRNRHNLISAALCDWFPCGTQIA